MSISPGHFAEIIIPLALPRNYTWAIPAEMLEKIHPGVRVEVNLGKNKKYAGIVKNISTSKPEFFEELYAYGEKIATMPEFKQPRGVKHFIYVNRTNFGLYTLLNELNATVRTDTYQPHF